MTWTFLLRGKKITLTQITAVTAVRPTVDARRRAASRSRLTQIFGSTAIDTAQGGRFGLDLPSRSRKLFERSGWLFIEPKPEVARAASRTRASVQDADSVQQVFANRSGNILISTDLLTVQADPEMQDGKVLQQLTQDGLRVVRRLPFSVNTFEVSPMVSQPLSELIEVLQAKPYYQFAEPMLLQALTGRHKPADPDYDAQWQHANDGSNGGTANADIGSEKAWELTRGRGIDRPMRIAVIDNGMQVNHPDLRDGIVGGAYFKSASDGSSNFVRFRRGMRGFPDNSHGTFCMGMAGARMDNNFGGCGSAPEADLLAIACADDQIGTQATLARAIAYAANPTYEDAQASAADGADVITCSLGPNGADWELTSVLELAIRSATGQGRAGKGTPIFWSVSNGYVEIARDEVCSDPNVIAVGSSNRNDLAEGSAYGSKLDFLAPGASVFSTDSRGKYKFDTGSSFSAPLVAGVGALILARNPQLTALQVRDQMRRTCDKIGGVVYDANGHNDDYGYGRVNAARAVK